MVDSAVTPTTVTSSCCSLSFVSREHRQTMRAPRTHRRCRLRRRSARRSRCASRADGRSTSRPAIVATSPPRISANVAPPSPYICSSVMRAPSSATPTRRMVRDANSMPGTHAPLLRQVIERHPEQQRVEHHRTAVVIGHERGREPDRCGEQHAGSNRSDAPPGGVVRSFAASAAVSALTRTSGGACRSTPTADTRSP